MVDDVRITESDLPPWATESTLVSLVKIISDLKGLTATESANTRKAIETLANSNGASNASTSDALSGLESYFARNSSSAQASRGVGDIHNNLADAANEMQNSTIKSRIYNSVLDFSIPHMQKFGKSIGLTEQSMGSLQGVVRGLVWQFIELTVKGVKASLDMYMELYKSGLLYNNMVGSATHGLGVLGQAAANAGTPVMAMAGLLKKYSESISRYGVEGFGIIASKTRDLGATLGMSASESADALAEYMDNQRRMGTLNSMSMDQVEKNASIQMRTTMNFAREMGVSTDLLKENQKKIADSAEFKAGMATIPMEIRAKMGGVASQILAMFDAKGMQDAGKEMMQVMAKGQLARGDKFMTDLMSLGPKGAQAANQMLELGESFKRGNISQEEMIKRYQGIMASMGDMSKNSNIGDFMAKMGVAGNDLTYMSSMFAAAAEAEADRKSGKTAKDDEIAKSMANMKTVWDRFTGIFTEIGAKLFGNQKFVDSITYAVESLSNNMMNLIPIIEKDMPIIIDYIGKFAYGLVELIDGIITGTGPFSDMMAWIKAIGVAFGDMFIGINNIITVFGWLYSGASAIASFLANSFVTTIFELATGMTSFSAFLGTALATFALGWTIFEGILNGIADFDWHHPLDSFFNIFVQIGNQFFKIGASIYYGLKEKLADLFFGETAAAKVRDEYDTTMAAIENNKPESLRAKEAEKKVEQVTQRVKETDENNKKTPDQQTSTTNNKGAATTAKPPSGANEATTTDVYQSNEVSNKINKSILEAAKYSNSLFEVMNGHLAAIEKNTKSMPTPGHF